MLEQLMLSLMIWLGPQTGLPVPSDVPVVQYHTSEQLCEIVYFEPRQADGLEHCFKVHNIFAAYDFFSNTVHLHENWRSTNVGDVSLLAHELVHFMQDRAGALYPCVGARERPAYEAQVWYLQERGKDFYRMFQVSEARLYASFSCDGFVPEAQ